MTMAGADRIAIDAAGPDPGAPAALDGLVDGDHHRPCGHEGFHQLMQQPTREIARRPAVAVEHAMEGGEGGDLAQAQDAQGGRDGPPAGGQDGAGDQHEHAPQGRRRERARKGCEPG